MNMTIQNDQLDFPLFVFGLTASGELIDGETPLSDGDIDKLPCVKKCLNAIRKFLPDDLASEAKLREASILLRVLPSEVAPPEFGPSAAHVLCQEVVDALARIAVEVRANAATARPLPLNKAVTLEDALPVLKALAGANVESSLEVELVAGDTRRVLPILEMADFSAGEEGENQRDTGEHQIKGLVRGDGREPHQLILTSGATVNLPAATEWAWEQIHDVLEAKTWLVGTLTRARDRGPWTVGDDAKLRRSPADIFASLAE